MASTYSVNIKLNTTQVKTDLQTIGKEIGNLGKNQSRGSKQALSAAQKQLKLDNASLRLKNQAMGLELKAMPIKLKNFKLEQADLKIQQAKADAEKFEFDLAKNSLLLADKEIRNAQILLKATQKTTQSKATQVKLQKQLSRLGPASSLPGLGSGAPLGLSGVEAYPVTNSGAMHGMALPPKLRGPTSPIRGSTTLPGSPAFLANQGKSKGILSSALISGGFPLLFGQGPLGALAGGLGGGIGAAVGGQTGGFAGGIAATAALTQIQQLLDSTGKLGQAFSTLTPDVESLTRALGANGTERERQIQLIKKTQGEQAALAAVTEQMNQQIGEKGVKNLKEFGETSRLIGNSFQILGTKMLAALAPILNFLAQPLAQGARKAETSRLADIGGAAGDPELQALEAKLGNIRGGRSGAKQKEKIQAQIDARKEELALLGTTIERRTTVDLVEDSVLKKGRQQNELLQAKLNGNYEEVLLAQQVEEKVREMLDNKIQEGEIDRKSIEDQIKKNQLLEKQVEAAEKLKDKMTAVGEEIEGSIKNNLRDAITGAQSFGEAMSNVLNKIRDKLLDKALDNIFGGFGENFGKSATGGKGKGIGGFIGGLFGFADGGKPPVGRPSIVGERGPELFVPRSAGTVVPNEKIGGTNITNNISISVDATDSNVQSDEDGQQFGEAIANAIQAEIIKQQRSGGLLR